MLQHWTFAALRNNLLVVALYTDPFLAGREKFPHPESHRKISNLITTELFFDSRSLNKSRGPLHTIIFKRIHLTVFDTDELKMAMRGRGFGETGPRSFKLSK